jgi:hypothetical protein
VFWAQIFFASGRRLIMPGPDLGPDNAGPEGTNETHRESDPTI